MVDTFLLEAAHFPKGRHDDQIDSMTQALEWMRDRQIPSSNFFLLIEQDLANRQSPASTGGWAKLRGAPLGVTHVQPNAGPTVMVRDGVIEVPDGAVSSLLKQGYVRIAE